MGSQTPIQELGEAVLDFVVAIDDSKCYVRCEHGGVCGLEPGHSGDHDADGHCQWKNTDD